MNLLLFGPPGSGKGTQAAKLRERLNVEHVSTGELLRHAVSQQSDLGRRVEKTLAVGELVSDDIVLSLIREAITHVRTNADRSGWLLDGFPRTVGQAEGLTEILNESGQKIDAILVLEVPRDVVIERMTARGRNDDTLKTVTNRLDVYESQTRPVLDYYDGRARVHRVNGNQPIDAVTAEVERVVQ